ncbi:hypothetical protein OSB04_010998 [Centaurea solstitialis]|uniref:non-specific serine/threonine protein kinase n=1 Tax=Centaurea solstitialis TaxID=347529 RepID=A0AA38WNP3_9ASTR|nr:hypothetical protein OSB04_010998 [Centaurea solstitialis]
MSLLEELDRYRIPLKDVKEATNNFGHENVVGEGSYGKVYKGELLRSKGKLVTVVAKLVDRRFRHGETHFLNDMKVLSSYIHTNIVSFIGFCDEHDEKIVVEEFVTKGSLEKYLGSPRLTWLTRLQICLGAARGLNHLHNGLEGESNVLHCDVRSRTILLDENWQAKISGFGLPVMGSMHPTIFGIIGGLGYVDPRYMQTGNVSKESDVYSFGVVLFEVLFGKLAYEINEEKKQLIGPFARLRYEEGTLNEFINPILREQMTTDSLEAFSAIAYRCLEKYRSKRPTMMEIVQKLEHVLGLQQQFEQQFDKEFAFNHVNLFYFNYIYFVFLKTNSINDQGKNLEDMKVPLRHIKLATHNFHDDFVIGGGGYGKVYKADLFCFDLVQRYQKRSKVAVKRLDPKKGQGTTEFFQEISVLLNFKHRNLVTLLGLCDEDRERILVYEYASKGSLEKYICSTDTKSNLTWALRLQICLDAARGLEYLHNVGEHMRIIHRDVKSSNVLLGENWVGKISDLGLSRIGHANRPVTFVMTQPAGTRGYVDPQYQKTWKLTRRSDVYSFGVVLLEVLSGRLAYQKKKDDQEALPNMARKCFRLEKVNEIIDPKLKKEFEKGISTFDDEPCPSTISIFAAITGKCLQEKQESRPLMTEVVEELEKAGRSHEKGVEALRTSLDKIRSATKDFSDILEYRVSMKVYRGKFPHSKGDIDVIVKQLDPIVGSYGNKLYEDIVILHRCSHKNVIPLLGFCEEEGERIVVFEHNMVNGSLKDHVKNANLTWKQRLQICVDAARGLEYIHGGAVTRHSIHGGIKSSSILLNHDWKAVISDFIIPKGVGTFGYYDPQHANTGIPTHKSDVYSFGVVLFEVLSGRYAIDTFKMDQKHPLHDVPNVEAENHRRGANKVGQMIFLAQLATQCFKDKRLEEIILHDLKGQIDARSLDIFSMIACRCLQERLEDRPTMGDVVIELEKALECQDEWEWEQKLPRDYEKMIKMSNSPMSNTSTKKDLHALLSSGILLHNEKQWISISTDGVINNMVSATKFSYKKEKWRPIRKSRFSKVAKISNVSDLNIQIQIETPFLTPSIMYGVYLVFKFCGRRKVSKRPLYVNLKYKKAGETLNAYFAEWRSDSNWLAIELFRFWNNNETTDFDVLLESFSSYYCGNLGIFIEGIEFQAIHNAIDKQVDCIEDKKENDEKNLRTLLRPELDMGRVEQVVIDCQEIINRSESNTRNASKEDLYFLLFKGILIDNGKKLFLLSKENGKKCHMLPAKEVIYNPSNVKLYNIKPQDQSRFGESVEILSRHELGIKCNIEKQMLSLDTTYACFLVFKLSEKCRGLKCPVKARDLLPHKTERTKIISFTSPSTVNLDKVKWIPKLREDGWMEVIVWETMFDAHNSEFIPMDLKLISFEGTMFGLIVCGIEFRPR